MMRRRFMWIGMVLSFLFSLAPSCPGNPGDPGEARMLPIPAGKFVRGACSERSNHGACTPEDLGYDYWADDDNEAPVREITLDAYSIGETEVTVAAYAACVEAGACNTPGVGVNCNWGNANRSDHPINCVSWFDANDYCTWKGQRLPTEAEWEKAARGGCEIAGDPDTCEPGLDDRRYPWGDEIPDETDPQNPDCSKANFYPCERHTAPVGSYPEGISPYGALDMAGNVAEWVADWYDNTYYMATYPKPDHSPSTNPQGPENGRVKVYRGGSWSSSPALNVRATIRGAYMPESKANVFGFRCVMDQ
ncbi:MAG: hypothetical protein D6795_14690 [Deltaproteobacteria bacterium]|nr:MAG: hypothetical protein D6795_14690 [Deltaproteobacteria bacterium]